MKSAGKARNNGLYRHIRTSKEIIRNLLNDFNNNRSDRRHFRRDLGLHGLYRPLVLYAFQNGKPCKELLFGTLRG